MCTSVSSLRVFHFYFLIDNFDKYCILHSQFIDRIDAGYLSKNDVITIIKSYVPISGT